MNGTSPQGISTTTIQDQIAALEAQKRQAEQAEQARLAEQTRNQQTIADAQRQIAQLQAVQRLTSLEAAIPSLADHAQRINTRNGELITALNEVAAEVENIYNDVLLAFGDWKDTAQLRESYIQSFIDGFDQRAPQVDGTPERQNDADKRQLLTEIGQADQKLPLAAMPQHALLAWLGQAANDTERRIRTAVISALFPPPSVLRQDYDPIAETRRELNERRRHGGF